MLLRLRYARPMTKFVRRGAVVDATEVTEANLERLAEAHGGTVFTAPDGQTRYALFESPEGTSRAEVGGFVAVTEGVDGARAYRDGESFMSEYQRP